MRERTYRPNLIDRGAGGQGAVVGGPTSGQGARVLYYAARPAAAGLRRAIGVRPGARTVARGIRAAGTRTAGNHRGNFVHQDRQDQGD